MPIAGDTVVIDVQANFDNNLSPGISQADRQIDRFNNSIDRTQRELDRLNGHDVDIDIEAHDRASSTISRAMAKARAFGGQTYTGTLRVLDLATRPIRAVSSALMNMETMFVVTIGAVFTGQAAINAPLQLADNITSAMIGFETMLGSVEAAEKMMNDIKTFAIETPFETMDIVANTQKMLAMGFEAEKVLYNMEKIGNATAATGGGAEAIDRVTLALGLIKFIWPRINWGKTKNPKLLLNKGLCNICHLSIEPRKPITTWEHRDNQKDSE